MDTPRPSHRTNRTRRVPHPDLHSAERLPLTFLNLDLHSTERLTFLNLDLHSTKHTVGRAVGERVGGGGGANLSGAIQVLFLAVWFSLKHKKWFNSLDDPFGPNGHCLAPQKGGPCHYVAALDQVVCSRNLGRDPNTGMAAAMSVDSSSYDPVAARVKVPPPPY